MLEHLAELRAGAMMLALANDGTECALQLS